MVRVRTAEPRDQALLRSLVGEAIRWHAEGERPAVEELPGDPRLAAYVDDFGRAGDFGVVAEEGVQPVGGAWWRYFSESHPGYGFVAEDVPELALAVFAGHRGSGVGTSLLSALLDEAEARRLPGLSLSVARDNPALRLYERSGFLVVGSEGDSLTMLSQRS